jgi:6-phosphofructokinase 2
MREFCVQPIITVTMNPAVDKSAVVEDVVGERKLRCGEPQREPGGGGINVARAIQKLDGEATAILPAGGPTGDMLTGLLDDEGLRQVCVPTEAWTRENLTIFEQSTSQQYRFGMPGPTLKPAEWQACLERIEDGQAATFVVASGSLPPGVPEDFYAQLGDATRRGGARLLLDTSGAPLRRAAERGVYLLKPNAREFEKLTGEPFESEEQQERLARDLVERNACEVLVLSLGAAGVLFVTRDHLERVRSPSVPIRSKVGAGDSMMAAIVLGLARDMGLREAVCYGVAAGAAAVMTPGTELCRKDDVEHLVERLRKDNGC